MLHNLILNLDLPFPYTKREIYRVLKLCETTSLSIEWLETNKFDLEYWETMALTYIYHITMAYVHTYLPIF